MQHLRDQERRVVGAGAERAVAKAVSGLCSAATEWRYNALSAAMRRVRMVSQAGERHMRGVICLRLFFRPNISVE